MVELQLPNKRADAIPLYPPPFTRSVSFGNLNRITRLSLVIDIIALTTSFTGGNHTDSGSIPWDEDFSPRKTILGRLRTVNSPDPHPKVNQGFGRPNASGRDNSSKKSGLPV
jgi:hypothetical protein